MYIKPITKFSVIDIIKANNLRRVEIQKVIKDKTLMNSIFLKLRNALDQCNNIELEDILSYELFFEVIPPECVAAFSLMYLDLGTYKEKDCCIQLLKDSYINKGTRGFLFSFMPIISKRLI